MAESFRKGIIQPTLIKQLQNILHQYPDDGQILKELIQNAEDAGAKSIKFMYDKTSYESEKGLYDKGLGVHQGPALYAYNDAVFTEEDWTGVRMIQDSIKAKDPLKVGRFGLGFKSVFHLTDLPGILSGKQVGYLDPHEIYFTKAEERIGPHGDVYKRDIPTSSYAWDLDQRILKEMPNQFKPFMHKIFGVDTNTFQNGKFEGTLFRFPLRHKTSEVSEILYTEEKVQDLIKLLEKEGHYLLLFLKSIESIQFYENMSQSAQPVLKLSIKISNEDKQAVVESRQNFVDEIRTLQTRENILVQNDPIICQYLLETELKNPQARLLEQKKWLVTQYYGGNNISRMNEFLDQTNNLPLVGVALPIHENSQQQKGHVFCFLPMPLDPDNESGFGVHINGYFAVDQNRRHLKWPSIGQSLEHSTDYDLKWNLFVLEHLIPTAVMSLLEYAVQTNTKNPTLVSPEQVYQIIPDEQSLKEHWKPVYRQFMAKVQDLHCLYSIDDEWIRPRASYILPPDLDGSFKEIVRKVVKEGHLPLVEPPSHVVTIVSNQVNMVDPGVVNQKLKMNDIHLKTEERKCLLNYFWTNSGIHHLMNLKLLQLSNDVVEAFQNPNPTNRRYLETRECPKSLLPGSDDVIVKCDPNDAAYPILRDIARSRKTQMQELQPTDIPQILKSVFQGMKSYGPMSNPLNIGKDWLQNLWQFIIRYQYSSISQYQELPIVPVDDQNWMPLLQSMPYIAKSTTERSLDEIGIQEDTLQKMGIIVVKNWKTIVGNLTLEVQKFISPPTVSGFLDTFLKVGSMQAKRAMLNTEEKIRIRDLICHEHNRNGQLKREYVNVLKHLPLFRCYQTLNGQDDTWVSSVDVEYCANFEYNFPLLCNIGILQECQMLCNIFGVKTKTSTEILLHIIFPELYNDGKYTEDHITNIMQQVLPFMDKHSRDNYTFTGAVGKLPFMSSKSKRFLKPCELVDPSDQRIKNLFSVLDIFPTGSFSDVKFVQVLKRYSLFRSISKDDVIALASSLDQGEVEQIQSNYESHIEVRCAESNEVMKAMELLEYVNNNPNLLTQDICMKMYNMKWVPVKDPNTYYPSKLKWFGQKHFLVAPRDVVCNQHENLVSSVRPLLPIKMNRSVQMAFKWNNPPRTDDVICQLHSIVKAFENQGTASGKGMLMVFIRDIYRSFNSSNMDENEGVASGKEMFMVFIRDIYRSLNSRNMDEVQDYLKDLEYWVWTGKVFTTVAHTVIQKPQLNLEPYIYNMPSEYQSLWSSNSLEKLGIRSSIPILDVLTMIKEYHDTLESNEEQQRRDLKLSIDILHHAREKKIEVPTDTPIPILTTEKQLMFVEMEKCVYCDQDTWKRKINIQDILDTDEVDEIYEVHADIPIALAKAIGVPSLVSRYLSAEPLPIDYGQNEPLTRRIRSLLEDYTDGSSVLKELLQNADDAGASTVSFIYDLRDFTKSSGLLIDEKMKSLQGPALLCHNDAEFTEEDFENIVKLSGATKKEMTEKIGKFGLGFNAVYNLTDAPSFVSGRNVVIFDPQVKYLGDAIKDPLQPGIKLHLEGHGKKIRRFKAQFEPFQNIMGCDLQGSKKYRGTLFRFPLRKNASDISTKCYDQKEVQALFNIFEQIADSLLLFMQNVSVVKFFEIEKGQELIPKGNIIKTPIQLIKSINHIPAGNTVNSNQWKDETKILKHAKQSHNIPTRNHCLLNTCIKMTEGKIFNESVTKSSFWCVSNAIGDGLTAELSRQSNELLPVGGVAVELEELSPSLYRVKPLYDRGQMFCFLPLPIKNGLPFHINGYFAVSANRKQLCTQDIYDKANEKATWNVCLMKDAVTLAHIYMLQDMANNPTLFDVQSLKKLIFQLFPTSQHQTSPNDLVFNFMESFYSNIYNKSCRIFPCESGWTAFEDFVFLSPEVQCITSKEFPSVNIVRTIKDECCSYYNKEDKDKQFVDMPLKIIHHMQNVSLEGMLHEKMIDLNHFYESIFLPNVFDIEKTNCDELLLYALLESFDELSDGLKENNCIPVSSGTERIYLKPTQLVHPEGPLKDLYDVEGAPFPIWLLQMRNMRLKQKIELGLLNLGMRREYLTDVEIIERAETIQCMERNSGLNRCRSLLELLSRTLSKHGEETLLSIGAQLHAKRILPRSQKPYDWKFQWYSDNCKYSFLSIDESYPLSQKELIGCSELVALFPHDSRTLSNLLGYKRREISLSQIDLQLNYISKYIGALRYEKPTYGMSRHVEDVVREIYSYLDSVSKDKQVQSHIKEKYSDRQFIFVQCKINGLTMITPDMCAKQKFDGEPYLYTLPNYMTSYQSLLKTVGIQDYFIEENYIQALQQISRREKFVKNGSNAMTVVRNIANALSYMRREDHKSNGEKQNQEQLIYLPDSKGVMAVASELCYNNCPWYENTEQRYLHQNIPFNQAECLGVKTVRQDMLKGVQSGIPFGQREKLTKRIKRILEGYPCSKEILNELLQNADDAGANQIHFILDDRNHSKDKIFDRQWEPLQGPALLVYNDKPFTQDDLAGIQNLGEGSKSLDPLTTGKYGVGFNCVYHLTDTPTFLTATENGDDHLLIALDPQCKFVPGSNREYPGQMFKDKANTQQKFPDVYKCFHLDIDTSKGTLFRFPLRTQEMARTSEISSTKISASQILKLFDVFEESMDECLLFVNNIKEIKLSKVDAQGKLCNIAYSRATVSAKDLDTKKSFLDTVKISAKAVSTCDLKAVSFSQCEYQMTIDSNRKKSSTEWLIVEQIGFQDFESVDRVVLDGYNNKKATLLPRGGVAYCLKGQEKYAKRNRPDSSLAGTDHETQDSFYKLFCFLPLPLRVSLQMHVNGYFVLDHESRKSLWKSEAMNQFSVLWNKLIFSDVICACYSTVLKYVQSQIHVHGSYSKITSELNRYMALFPDVKNGDYYMDFLQQSIYSYMVKHQENHLPVLLRKQIWENPKIFPQSENVDLKWYKIGTRECPKIYIDNLSCQIKEDVGQSYRSNYSCQTQTEEIKKQDYVRNVLHNSKFPITYAKNHVLKNITSVYQDVNLCYINPSDVLMFFSEHSADIHMCPIASTPFVESKALDNVLSYCKSELSKHLDALPLLLTEDQRMQKFSKLSPKFISSDSYLIPSRPDKFAAQLYFSYQVENMESYLKPMTCKDLSDLLKYELNEQVYYGPEKVAALNPQSEQMKWFIKIWTFIHKQSYKSQGTWMACKYDDSEFSHLKNWCILPVKSRTFQLWSLARASEILILKSYGIQETFQKMKFPQAYIPVDLHYPETTSMIKVIEHLTCNFSKPDEIIVALREAIRRGTIDFSDLTKKDCIAVLKYFNDSIRNRKLSTSSIPVLKKLPFYMGKNDSLMDLSNVHGSIYTVPNEIPSAKNWSRRSTGDVYLCRMEDLDQLYSFIGIDHLNVENAYSGHILKFFDVFSDTERYDHLLFLRKRIEMIGGKGSLLHVLQNVPILPNEKGELQVVSSFYDERVELFRHMETSFPRHPYDTIEWNQFLKKIGLVHSINGDLVLKYAREIERNSQSWTKNTAMIRKQSAVLCDVIFSPVESNNLLHNIAHEVKRISFLPPKEISENLIMLCHPVKPAPFLSFSGSSLCCNEVLLWTKYPVLSELVVLQDEHLAKQLGIVFRPSISDVVDNIRNVCSSPKLEYLKDVVVSVALRRFIINSFAYIQEHHKEEDLSILKHTSCILVESRNVRVKPVQVSMEIPPGIKEHVIPYLVEFPLYLGSFKDLLLKIGITKTVTPEQYVSVLETVFLDSMKKELHPPEQYAVIFATKGLFEISLSRKSLSLDRLYLLARDGKMYEASRIIYLDRIRLGKRISELPMPFLIDLTEVTKLAVQHIRMAISKLPDRIKPKLLSKIVKEDMEDECLATCQKTDRCLSLKNRFSSDEFASGLIRIIRHNDATNNLQGCDKEDLKLVKKLHDIEFYELERVKTYLVFKSQRLPKSEEELPFYIKKEKSITVYLSGCKTNRGNLISTLCKLINIIMNHKLDSISMGSHLHSVLACRIEDIESTLDNEDVLPYDAISHDRPKKNLPYARGYVPVKFHHLLSPAVELLQVGEMVAYEVYDPLEEKLGQQQVGQNEEGLDDSAVYRYADVKEILEDNTFCYRDYRYKIYLGEDEFVEVHASELYLFKRPKPSSGPVVLSDQQDHDVPDATNYSNVAKKFEYFEDIKKVISETLEEAWRMDEKHKKKIIKRLMLEWHPDKNPDCVDLATEAFKFIQNKIERLEKGLSRSEVDGANFGGKYSGFNFHNYFGSRARSHYNYRNEFKDEYKGYSGTRSSRGSSYFTPPRHTNKNPQPAEARRWMKQADYDLSAVLNDMEYNHTSYEWACFKCHQAAEKALKATQFAVDSNLKDNERTLYRLCNAINDSKCMFLARSLESLVIGSAAMRYPDRHYGGQTPHDTYTREKALSAKDYAEKILQKCRQFIMMN